MTKEETNGFLMALERQMKDIESQLEVVFKSGNLCDTSDAILRETKINLINLNQRFSEIRGWNY